MEEVNVWTKESERTGKSEETLELSAQIEELKGIVSGLKDEIKSLEDKITNLNMWCVRISHSLSKEGSLTGNYNLIF